ncbi:VOC family protein [Egibacter rhizosphaerae]|uniref:VOC family protein n=1 Tax=Egibacter rhizosphaerae TaxID=1670831 RepID=A0A411YFW0_9ACTN|nr:VOC family protein [Egibacter rhizosphaerae]QBI20120.1 VOC family protein [Egibacter rhizosphaerae]
MFTNSSAFSGFAVNDLAAAEAFYRDTLELEVSQQHGLATLHLGSGTDVLIYPKPGHVPATFTILNFPVNDINTAVDELAARDVTLLRYDHIAQDDRGIVRPPQGHGPLIAWFIDPAGNTLAVLEDQ